MNQSRITQIAAGSPATAEEARELAGWSLEAMALLGKIAKQKPEKPDYWSSCSQCGRNQSDAEDLAEKLTAAPNKEN